MIPEPPEDDMKSVYCQNCDEWRHPRHTCARDPAHETAPLPVLRLLDEGPLGSHEVGIGGPNIRRRFSIGKLDLDTVHSGRSSVFGQTHSVYYLFDEHDPAEVIEEWIEVNYEQLSGRGLTIENITRALSKNEFKDAWRELRQSRDFDVLSDDDPRIRGGGQTGKFECPYCGEAVKRLPTHLPCDGGGSTD